MLTECVERAVKRLPKRQRQIIEKRYLEDEDAFDYIVCTELGMSESTYGRQKAKAVYRLAFMLNLEVLAEETPDPNTRMKMICGYGGNAEVTFMEKQPSVGYLVITMLYPKVGWEECVKARREQDRLQWERKKRSWMKGEVNGRGFKLRNI